VHRKRRPAIAQIRAVPSTIVLRGVGTKQPIEKSCFRLCALCAWRFFLFGAEPNVGCQYARSQARLSGLLEPANAMDRPLLFFLAYGPQALQRTNNRTSQWLFPPRGHICSGSAHSTIAGKTTVDTASSRGGCSQPEAQERGAEMMVDCAGNALRGYCAEVAA
jgi:hypothetical protein